MGLSGGDLVFVRESAEDLFSADPVPGEVDLRWPGVSLSRRELAKGTARSGMNMGADGGSMDKMVTHPAPGLATATIATA